MNLRSSLRALALAGVCALPLPAGVLTFTLTESGGNVIVTAFGSITDPTAWSTPTPYPGGRGGVIAPNLGGVALDEGLLPSTRWQAAAPLTLTAFGPGGLLLGGLATGDTVVFASQLNWLYLPSSYTIGSTATPLNSTETYLGQTLSSIGAIAGTYSYVYGGDTIRIQVGTVPDTGASAAGVGLALAGLFALRGRRAGRRTV